MDMLHLFPSKTASDVFILKNSGFQFLPGDEVLADPGITIDGILPSGVKPAAPACAKGLKELLDTEELFNNIVVCDGCQIRLMCYTAIHCVEWRSAD